jgi:hypothetical protein
MRWLAAALVMTIPAHAAAPSIVGNWFGTGQPGDKTSMYLDKFQADGKFHSDFRECQKGKALDSNEDGTWSMTGNLITLQVQLHNGSFAPVTELYRLVSITPQAFKDVYEPLNFPYDEHRVAAKFTLPDCQLVS